MSSKTLFCKNWNFDLEKPIGLYKDLKQLKKNQQFFIVEMNDSNEILTIEHKTKTTFFSKRMELFNYEYNNHQLTRRNCYDRSSNLKWYNQYQYNQDSHLLERCDTLIKHLENEEFELLNYSLYYYDNSNQKNLRKIMNAQSELTCYEVFHYENSRLMKKEMFNQNNEKMLSEMYNYDNDGKLLQIDYFDLDGNHDRSIAMEIYL